MHYTKRLSMTQVVLLSGVLIGLGGCAAPMLHAVFEGDKAKVQALLDRGVDVNARVYAGGGPQYAASNKPALMLAARAGRAEMIQFLIDKGAQLEIRDLYGSTPLMEAAHWGRLEAVKVLLAAGADPLAVNRKGETPLMFAKGGAELAIRGEDGRLPLDFPKLVQLLEEAERKARRKSGKKTGQETSQAALEAKLPEIQSAEKQGDEAAHVGRHADALASYAAALREAPPGTEPQQRLRENVIRAALSLDPPPPIPEDARHHANRGMAFVKKATSRDEYDLAVSEFEQALLIAPWWGDAYFNLGLVQEKVEEYDAAIRSFRLYLLATPGDPNAGAVKKKIAELEVAQELAEGHR